MFTIFSSYFMRKNSCDQITHNKNLLVGHLLLLKCKASRTLLSSVNPFMHCQTHTELIKIARRQRRHTHTELIKIVRRQRRHIALSQWHLRCIQLMVERRLQQSIQEIIQRKLSLVSTVHHLPKSHCRGPNTGHKTYYIKALK